MAQLKPIQQSFSAGEISPRMSARSDVDGYHQSASFMENFIPYSHGPIDMRGGFQHMTSLTEGYARIFPFFVNLAEGYKITITTATVSVIDRSDGSVIETFTSPWTTIAELERIQYDMPPAGQQMFFFSPNVEPHRLVYDGADWTFDEMPLVPPGTESDVVWEDGNWPQTVTFFQGRMWLGGINSHPEAFWGSESGVYFNFLLPADDPEPADPMEFIMSKKGAITWLVGAKNLLMGTENGEHIITSEAGLIIPADIEAEQQSAFGSAPIQPEQVGNRVLFISPDRRKVRELNYQWEDQGWVSRDLTFMSEHITKEDRIKRIYFAQNPENIIWMATTTGKILGCTYEKVASIIGWHRHSGQGACHDICVLSTTESSELWGSFDRIDGGSETYIEKYTPDEFLDSWADQTHGSPSIDVGPFPHLANQTVSVKVDGGYHPNITLDASGEGTIQNPATYIVVGFGYSAPFVSMPLDRGSREGTGMGDNKRWNNIQVRIVASVKPKIGTSAFKSGPILAPERHPATPMNLPEPAATEDVKVTTLGYDQFAQVYILQDLPFRTMVVAVFGEVGQEST